MLTLIGVKLHVCDLYGKQINLAQHLKGHMSNHMFVMNVGNNFL